MENTKKQWSDKTLQTVERLCLFDDDFMSLVFERNKEATEFLLNTIFDRDDLKVIEVVGQRELKNPVIGGRCITIDIYAVDSKGKVYNVEVQQADSGAVPQRARFHSAMIDTRMLRKKQEFKEIKDSYIIFITKNDVLGGGLPLYHIDRVITELDKSFGDGAHIIYVNGAYKNTDTAIGKMVHDFGCANASDMYCTVLKNQVRYYKETEGGQEIMCEIIEEYAKEYAKEYAEDTRIESLLNSVTSLMDTMKLTVDQAMNAMKISSEDQAVIRQRMQ